MKKCISTLIIITIAIMLLAGSLNVNAKQYDINDLKGLSAQELSECVLRLHIKANSNNEDDQNIKLLIRDAIIQKYSDMFSSMSTLEEASAFVEQNKEQIIAYVNEILIQEGFSYNCDIKLERCEFPEKNYGGVIFPKGEYLAVNILLGNGEGDNWWCVLFPPLCFINVNEDQSISDIKNKEVIIKWKILELWEEWFGKH